MSPIRALLWKEGREATYKIAAGAGVAFFVGLVNLYPDRFYPLGTMSHLVGILGAVRMGMDVVAGERSRGTLPFLLSRSLSSGRLLGVKFAVGAGGLLAVLAAYWAGVYLGVSEWGNPNFLFGFGIFHDPSLYAAWDLQLEELLKDVGYGRMLLLWFFLYLLLYAAVFLASAFTDRALKAAVTGLMVAWVGFFFLGITGQLFSDAAWYYIVLVFKTDFDREAGILRQAFDPSLLLARVAAAALPAVGVLLWVRRGVRVQASRRFQWVVGALVLVSCGVIVIGKNATRSHRARDPIAPVGRLPYEMGVKELALQEELAVVLLERGVSVVDVADPRALAEIGRVEIEGWRLERLALSGSTAYVWGETEAHDSVGVAVFDLSHPERPRLQAQRLLHSIETGPTPWLKRIPRLMGWAAWEGHLYAGLLGSEFLQLHSFDVREGGLPQPVQVLPLEERARHVWNYDGEMRLAGPHAFLTLGHDFVVLDLTDPRQPEELSRTPLCRFGHSKQYEESIEKLHHQLSPGALPDSVAQKLDQAGLSLRVLEMRGWRIDGERIYRIAAPEGLGPITLGGDRAYVQRHWPVELAVVDISDPRRPVEVDYIPGGSFYRGLTMDGDFAYAPVWKRIEVYAVTGYGDMRRRETLGFADEEKDPLISALLGGVSNTDQILNIDDHMRVAFGNHFVRDRVHNNIIPAGDHIYAVLKNNLVVFKALQGD